MQKLQFSETIKAPAGKVWSVLWNDDTYRKWTSVFHEGSYAKSDWKEGSRIEFLSPDGNGMYSTIEKMVPNELMSFKHLGEIKAGKDQPWENNGWSGAHENYTLMEDNGNTKLTVELDTDENFANHFKDIFPKALKIVKELAEK